MKSVVKSGASTALVIVKTLITIISLYVVFLSLSQALTGLGLAFGGASIADVSAQLSKALEESVGANAIPVDINVILTGLGVLGTIAIAGLAFILVIYLIGPILNLLDTIGSNCVRGTRRCAGMVKTVHVIYMIFALIGIAINVALGVLFALNINTVNQASNASLSLAIVESVFVIFIILLIPVFCYHKDISSRMKSVGIALDGGPVYVRKNHLSGISTTFGAIAAAGAILTLIGFFTARSVFGSYMDSISGYILLAYLPLISAKYFLVTACNHNIKALVK